MAAKRVGAKRMLLSHFKPYHDIRELQKEASEYYPNVEVTVMHKTYKI
jgi:ribonuclease BN (tRNA processing enzyme)